MPNLTIRNVPKGVYKLLHESARQHNRSLNGEIVSVLTFEADLARAGLEVDRTSPTPHGFGQSGRKNSNGSRQVVHAMQGNGRR